MSRSLLLFALMAVLPACATGKQAQVRGGLIDAGLSEPVARCMAEPLGNELSVNQLRGLQRVSKMAKKSARQMTEGQILDLLRRDLDPETVGVVARAGIGCFLRG